MKIERTGRGASTSAVTSSGYTRRGEAATAVHPGEAPAAVTSVLGIPESEFTPRVRDAIMSLMQEVDSLRRELEHTKRRLDEAEKSADQDHLLPMLNRRAFVRELSRTIGHSARYGTPASLVYFDLDDFKQINDTYGHAAGDMVLHHFAQTLMSHVRDSDIVGRLGGDEFSVILSHAGQVQAHKKAEALAETLSQTPPLWKGKPIPLSFSYGTFELLPGESADSAIARADEAMYAHKKR
ncbi:MAG: GGDEF domain-containing protein [Alphaproteobacteria bacterium]|nr:GGDEF domain-containing protein [Alphaproteobacteria bacterium]MDE2075143.1 GGDEF domain-containing protein [Alphaproteobacteria bacterium]MDE2350342.1 GGDEF domain-containing protein [Alphaproteobacteria bacterium]